MTSRLPARRASAPRAFTLVEVMVALVITGLVVSLAYATTQAGFDTESALARHRDGAERLTAVRALLSDALRHQVDGMRGGATIFALDDRVAADGGDADSLHLTTRGVVAPLGATGAWHLDAWRSHDTLRVEARALQASPEARPVSAVLPGVTRFDVQVLGRGLTAAWRDAWPDDDVAPDAIALTLQRADGAPVTIVVRRGLERAP